MEEDKKRYKKARNSKSLTKVVEGDDLTEIFTSQLVRLISSFFAQQWQEMDEQVPTGQELT
jgi:hypothetical protein